MSGRDTRKEFEEIVGRLTITDPSLARSVRMISRRTMLTVLAVGGTLTWAGLSILMVVWGAAGVIVTCGVVASAAGLGILGYKRHVAVFGRSIRERPSAGTDPGA